MDPFAVAVDCEVPLSRGCELSLKEVTVADKQSKLNELATHIDAMFMEVLERVQTLDDRLTAVIPFVECS